MAPQDDRLLGLARAHFKDLTAAEIELLRAAPKGNLADCGPKVEENGTAIAILADYNPKNADHWGKDRQIRADLIRWLCVNRQARKLVDPKGIQACGAKVSGALDLSYVAAPFRLSLRHCRLTGETNLAAAEIALLNFGGSSLDSITADGAKVKGDVFLHDGFHAAGEVRLLAAEIGGDLNCISGTFENPSQPGDTASRTALNVERADVKGSIFLREGFSAKGEVRLLDAQIGGSLECEGGIFENPPLPNITGSGRALNADRAVVNGSVFLNQGFSAKGEVRLPGAQIGGNLECDGASFENQSQAGVTGSGTALTADRTVVMGSVFLRATFIAKGDARLIGARVAGDLSCRSATFAGTLYVEKASIKGTMYWLNVADASEVRLDLTDTSVDALIDDETSWPSHGSLFLEGFVYRRFSGDAPKDARTRLKWLDLQSEFRPQPYRQLAKVLKDEGDDAGARQVLYEMERRRRAQATPPMIVGLRSFVNQHTDRLRSYIRRVIGLAREAVARPWNFSLRYIVGYGYYPARSLISLVVLVLLGWGLFRAGYFARNIVPTDKDAYWNFEFDHRPPAHYQQFHAFVYSLENSLPLVKLGQADRWQPDPSPKSPSREHENWKARFLSWITSSVFLRVFLWIQILLGWILATFFAAGVSGIVRKD
jgi:hypothetical protein